MYTRAYAVGAPLWRRYNQKIFDDSNVSHTTLLSAQLPNVSLAASAGAAEDQPGTGIWVTRRALFEERVGGNSRLRLGSIADEPAFCSFWYGVARGWEEREEEREEERTP
jgi:hypothetical protein